MAVVQVVALDATLGAVVSGFRLAGLDDSDWNDVHDAFLEHAVLVFPGQGLTEADQVAFARRFGDIEHIVADRDAVSITNRLPDGTLAEPESPHMQIVRGNAGWHTDSSYMPVSARASMLSAQVVPADGGQTEWADMRAAYDALDAETRERIAGLAAHHSYRYSQARDGYESTRGYGFDQQPQLRPLVKVHPETGRPALYIGRHANAIDGLDEHESEQLLDGLLGDACRPPRVYRHEWEVGDLVVWDNRCVLHRLVPWDLSQPREMRHTRIAGDPVSEGALAPA